MTNNVDVQTPYLERDELETLLKLSRETLEAFVLQGDTLDLQGFALTEKLRSNGAAFVTLRRQGMLRGCIGHTRFLQPLAASVRDNTVNAAARDPRFGPLTAQELPDTHIEISVLCPGGMPDSPFIEVDDPNDIILGRDGLYLTGVGPRGGGLLLPQVAIENEWGLEAFLDALCNKAGAGERAWEQPDSKLFRFAVQIIREEGEPLSA